MGFSPCYQCLCSSYRRTWKHCLIRWVGAGQASRITGTLQLPTCTVLRHFWEVLAEARVLTWQGSGLS